MDRMSIREELYEYISGLAVINTHSHHLADGQFPDGMGLDFILKNSYIAWAADPPEPDIESRRQYILANRCNSYFRWLFEGIKAIYGLEATAVNFDAIDELIRTAHKDRSYHIQLLKDQCKYERVILDKYDDPGSDNSHPDLFAPAFRINMFPFGYSTEARDHNGSGPYGLFHDQDIRSFHDYLEAMKAVISEKKKKGAVALKNALAYDRPLFFENDSIEKACRAFHNPLATKEEIRDFGDFIMFHIAGIAKELDMPIQIHTGLGTLDGTRAIGLRKLIETNPDVRFDLFHGGYPWTSDVLALLHNYKNVYADLCWLPLISTQEAREFIQKALEVSSAHRILWGCDTWTGEESYGALLAVHHALTEALADMILDGAMDMEYAKYCAKRILYDNAKELFKL